MSRVGGHKRKAWRLKKKYRKWFHKALQELILDTLDDVPASYFEEMFSGQDYDFSRVFK